MLVSVHTKQVEAFSIRTISVRAKNEFPVVDDSEKAFYFFIKGMNDLMRWSLGWDCDPYEVIVWFLGQCLCLCVCVYFVDIHLFQVFWFNDWEVEGDTASQFTNGRGNFCWVLSSLYPSMWPMKHSSGRTGGPVITVTCGLGRHIHTYVHVKPILHCHDRLLQLMISKELMVMAILISKILTLADGNLGS